MLTTILLLAACAAGYLACGFAGLAPMPALLGGLPEEMGFAAIVVFAVAVVVCLLAAIVVGVG